MSFIIKENKTIDEKYYYTKHKSGLDIYIIPKNHTNGYAVFGTKFGSVDNHFKVDGKEIFLPDGIAHFLEHKLFENEDGVDTFQKYAEYGAEANAYTSSDKTVYLFSCTENFTNSLEILLDFVTHPYFTKQTVEKEQGIIGQEIRMYEDNPGWRLYFNMLNALYVNHPAKIDTAGTIETIAQITPEKLFEAYNTFYNLHNMALCVCADIDPDEVLKIADKILKPAPALDVERIMEKEPENICQKRISQKLSVSMPMFSIGFKDNDVPLIGQEQCKKNAECEILLELIFGKSSELYTKIYESGLINGSFGFGMECHDNFSFAEISGYSNNPEKVYEQVMAEIQKFSENGIDENDFERTKRVCYSHSIRSFDSTEDIANGFLGFVFSSADMLDYPSVINSVKKSDVEKRLSMLFKEDNAVMSTILPIE